MAAMASATQEGGCPLGTHLLCFSWPVVTSHGKIYQSSACSHQREFSIWKWVRRDSLHIRTKH